MSGISRIKNSIYESLGLNEWGQRDIIPNNFNAEIVETNQEFQPGAIDISKIKNLVVDTITVSPTGYIRSGKTTFSDSTNAGYYFSADGVYIGAASDATYLKYDVGAGTFLVKAAITTTAGSVISTGYLSGTIAQANLNVSDRGWSQTCAFSSTDLNTVTWGAGTFTSADGTAYSILTGNTGNMAAKTYIYLDIAVSTTAYQITTTSSTAVGAGKVLIAVAQNAAVTATYALTETSQIVGDNIIANTIDASKITTGQLIVGTNVGLGTAQDSTGVTTIIGNTVTTSFINALNVNAATVSASISISSPTITGGTITIGTGDAIFKAGPSGIQLGHATFASASFRVDMAGALTATSATITGALTTGAGSSIGGGYLTGAVGAWNITAGNLRSGTTDANSNVLLDGTNSILRLGPTTGNYITLDGVNQRIRSSNYSAGVSGFTIEPDLIEADNIKARGSLQGVTFSYDKISAIGGQLMVANADTLATDMTAADNSTLTIKGDTTFAVDDFLLMRGVATTGIDAEWMRVTDASSAPTYTVVRDLAGSYASHSNPVWKAGTPIVKQGSWSSTTGNAYTAPTLTGNNTPSTYTVFETLRLSGSAGNLKLTVNGTNYDNSELIAAFTLQGATYDSKTFNTSAPGTTLQIYFKPDGTKIYYSCNEGGATGRIFQRTLSTAWDISTASGATSVYGGMSRQLGATWLSSDGTKIYITENNASSDAYLTTSPLSTAWDLSTMGAVTNYFGLGTVFQYYTGPGSIQFNANGTKLWIGYVGVIKQYTLSTAWDMSTASYDNKSFTTAENIFSISDDGYAMLTANTSTIKIYNLSTAFDISTATDSGNSINISAQTSTATSITLGPNKDKYYVKAGGVIYQYGHGTPITSQNDVASRLQTLIRSKTSLLETVAYSTDHFIITGVTPDYLITVSAPSTGTDVSGAGATKYLDLASGISTEGGYGVGGWLRLFGEGTNAPYYSVFKRLSGLYNNYVETCRLGNLNGFLGYAVNEYGIAIGDANGYLKYDPTNGFRLGGTSATFPLVSSGTAAPTTTPGKIGDMYVDTTNHKIYVSDGTTNSTNWRILN